MTTEVDISQFREHRTREELNALLHYGHIIPVSKGWTREYVDTNYRGWTWNALISIFTAAGIIVPSAFGGPPKCDDRVAAVHFSSNQEFLVEWSDGISSGELPGET